MADTILGEVGFWPRGEWNAKTAYPFLSLVAHNGGSYVARQDVPAGTALTDASYWMPISDTKETVRELIEQHPEWVTTVEDGSISVQKLTQALATEIGRIPALDTGLTQVGNAVDGVADDVTLLSARLDNFISGDPPEEGDLQDIQTGYDGTVWDTPGNAVRGQAQELSDRINAVMDALDPVNATPLTVGGDYQMSTGTLHIWESGGWLNLTGTSASAYRHFVFTNGVFAMYFSTSDFTKIVEPGTYVVRIESSGFYSGVAATMVRWTYDKFDVGNPAHILYDGDTITFTQPAMLGMYLPANTNFGDAENGELTKYRFRMLKMETIDKTARSEINRVEGRVDALEDSIADITRGSIEDAVDWAQVNAELAVLSDGQLQRIRLECTESFSRYVQSGDEIIDEAIELKGTDYIRCPKYLAFHFTNTTARAYVYFYAVDGNGNYIPRWDVVDFTASTGAKNYLSATNTYNRVIPIPDGTYMRVAIDTSIAGDPMELYSWTGKHFGHNITADQRTPDRSMTTLFPKFYINNHCAVITPGSSKYMLLNGWKLVNLYGVPEAGGSRVDITPRFTSSTNANMGFFRLPRGYRYFIATIQQHEWVYNVSGSGGTTNYVPACNLNDSVSVAYAGKDTVVPAGLAHRIFERAKHITEIRWKCLKKTPYAYGTMDNPFRANCDYSGIPYSSGWINNHFFGWHISLHTFLNAANDLKSKFYEETDRKGTSFGYGLVCSTFATLCAGWPYPVVTYGMLHDPQIEHHISNQPEIGSVMYDGVGHCLLPERIGTGVDGSYYTIYECGAPTTVTRNEFDFIRGEIGSRYYDYLSIFKYACSHVGANVGSTSDPYDDAEQKWTPYDIWDGSITNGTARPYRGDRCVCTNLDAEAVAGGGVKINIHSDVATALYCKRMTYNPETKTFSSHGTAPTTHTFSNKTAYIPFSGLVDGGFYGVYTDADDTMEYFEYHQVSAQHFTDAEDDILFPDGEFWYACWWQGDTLYDKTKSGKTEVVPYLPSGSAYTYADYRRAYKASYKDGKIFYKGVLGAYCAPLICDNPEVIA